MKVNKPFKGGESLLSRKLSEVQEIHESDVEKGSPNLKGVD